MAEIDLDSPLKKRLRKRTKVERVFKTPISYSPRMTGDQARPSPSKFEIWKEELGLNDCNLATDPVDDEDNDKENKTETSLPCSVVEYRALQKELDVRNSERETLLIKLKTLADKNKQCSLRLESDDRMKKQQLKILQKSHEIALSEKEALVHNLESIIRDQEAKLAELDKTGQASEGQPGDRFHLLIRQIEDLQERIVKLEETVQVEQCRSQNSEYEQTTLRATVEELKEKLEAAEEDNSKLRLQLGNLNTDDQKMMNKLESENTSLQSALRQVNSEVKSVTDTNNRLQENNSKLTAELTAANQQVIALKSTQGVQMEEVTAQLNSLRQEKNQLAQTNWNLQCKIDNMLLKSPEVVTKVAKVEVESKELRSEYETLRGQFQQFRDQATDQQAQIDTLVQDKAELQGKVTALTDSNSLLMSEKEQLEVLVDKLQEEMKEIEEKCQEDLQTIEEELLDRVQRLQEQHNIDVEEVKKRAEEIDEQYRREMNRLATELKNARGNASKFENQLQMAKVDCEARCSEVSRLQAQLSGYEASVGQLQAVLDKVPEVCQTLVSMRQEYNKLTDLVLLLPQLVKQETANLQAKICSALLSTETQCKELITKYRTEMARRKAYHNQLVELKGNIRVFCRIRPLIHEDGAGAMAQQAIQIDPDDNGLVHVSGKSRANSYEIDQVFGPESTQEQIFDEVKALITSCVDGYNICIFAYGQTGSGKTYTMQGSPSDPGINERALRLLFEETNYRSVAVNFSISVSMLEIYNESIRDLLQSSGPTLDVRMSPEGGLCVPGLTEVTVQCVEDITQVFTTGQKNRATACTNLNEHSSRSHALLCIKVFATNAETRQRSVGTLNLVDLAGSERVSKSGADGVRLKEAQSINKSLSCLGDVVHALKNKQAHVPYRNSKLTYLLQDSLGGNSKTLMLVQVAPIERHIGESMASLSFAQRIQAVELGAATKRVDEDCSTPSPNHARTPSKHTPLKRR